MVKRTADEAAETRRALLEAALMEFADKGFHAAKLADIAARAGVTRGALYHHFADKTEMYGTVLDDGWEIATEEAWSALDADGTPRERLRNFLLDLYRLVCTDQRFRALLVVSIVFPSDVAGKLDDATLAAKAAGIYAWADRLAAVCEEAGSAHPRRSAALILTWFNGLSVSAAFTPAVLGEIADPYDMVDYIFEGLL
ncbi:TetR/AcrR family transcriptional regulator [Fodinicola acaciae]|uniref:TetR/AcrR family transcriptional regulator n=1 Tax=Fodinicola acaciae TaxID=2681555 RepID=UPI0013D66092|nr:TetR family transcriptional regulator [Fodinicola acaciae]